MDFVKFKKNGLFANNISLNKIASKKQTPFYLYSKDQIKKNVTNLKTKLKSSKPLICFAVKSNSNLEILKYLAKLGLGADVVSIGELQLAMKAGFSSRKIVFSGVGKTSDELVYAIKKNRKLITPNDKNILENKFLNFFRVLYAISFFFIITLSIYKRTTRKLLFLNK